GAHRAAGFSPPGRCAAAALRGIPTTRRTAAAARAAHDPLADTSRSARATGSRATNHCIRYADSATARRRLGSSGYWPPSFSQTWIALALQRLSPGSPSPEGPLPSCELVLRLNSLERLSPETAAATS